MAQTDKKLHHLTIHEAGKLLKEGDLSPVELTQAFFDRIAETDDRLHSFITLLHEDAMSEARAAEAEIRSGRYRGPLHGIHYRHSSESWNPECSHRMILG